MYASSSILFLILLHLLRMLGADTIAPENQLPLVYILEKDGELKYPNRITKTTLDDNLRFTGETQFSKDDSNNQMFFCPIESDKQKEKIEKYNKLMINSSHRIVNIYKDNEVGENCLFHKTFEKEDVLRCRNDAIPSIHPIRKGTFGDDKLEFCGPDKRNVLFKFVYEVCKPIKWTARIKSYIRMIFHFEIATFLRKLPFVYGQEIVYEVCYHLRDEKIIYTKHRLASGNLLFNEDLQLEGPKEFSMMTEANPEYFDHDEFSKLIPFYDRLSKNPTEQNQLSNNEESDTVKTNGKYIPEKLVPPDDLATALLKKPTFHYINVKPMHQDLVELWNYIAKLVRENFKDSDTKGVVEIYTGAFTSPDENNWPANVPEIWIKVIHQTKLYRSSSLVIIMKNDSEKKEEPYYYDYTLNNLCDVDYCSSFKKDERVLNRFTHLVEKIRCCPFNRKIDAFFDIYVPREYSALLPIANLTDNVDKDENI